MKIEAPQEEEESFEGFQESKITGQNVQILLDIIPKQFVYNECVLVANRLFRFLTHCRQNGIKYIRS